MPDDLRPLVLDACRRLMARGVYPSVVKIQDALPRYVHHTAVWDARRALILAGEIPAEAANAPARPWPKRAREAKGLTGKTAAELAVIALTAAQIRAELATRLPEDPRPVTGRILLDQMSSPGLDKLSPARVSAIVRRRCRGMFRARRQGARV